jgi:hypothetical protein
VRSTQAPEPGPWWAGYAETTSADLYFVVDLHERAHAALHLCVHPSKIGRFHEDDVWNSYVAKATEWFDWIEPHLHEKLAQLISYQALLHYKATAHDQEELDTANRRIETFSKLMNRAASRYQIQNLMSVPKARLDASILLLRERKIVGLDAWETVMTW